MEQEPNHFQSRELHGVALLALDGAMALETRLHSLLSRDCCARVERGNHVYLLLTHLQRHAHVVSLLLAALEDQEHHAHRDAVHLLHHPRLQYLVHLRFTHEHPPFQLVQAIAIPTNRHLLAALQCRLLVPYQRSCRSQLHLPDWIR